MNDGGPAFQTITEIKSTVVGDQVINFDVVYKPGMSMLDHFAGLAMKALLTEENSCAIIERLSAEKGEKPGEFLGILSYQVADGMLKERDRRKEKANADNEAT